MEVQSICLGLPLPKLRSSVSTSDIRLQGPSFPLGNASKLNLPHLKGKNKGPSSWSLKRGTTIRYSNSVSQTEMKLSGTTIRYSNSVSQTEMKLSGTENSRVAVSAYNATEPFRGKSGSVSFYGLTHQLVEEGKLMSAPFQEEKGSFLWILAPVMLISSLIFPQFFLGNAIESVIKDEILVEIVASLSFESMFYIGLAAFLLVTDRVQRPYLQFSAKRWGLITGLRGYLTSAFFTMGFKVVAPLFAVYVTWPMLGLPALVAVVPFLVGCAAQLAFERHLEKCGSSSWPLIPIIFEVYRLYQLSKAAHFIERLLFSMKDVPGSPQLMERTGAMVAMVVTFQVLGVVCLWSLLTFLMRLFPSRPVVENY